MATLISNSTQKALTTLARAKSFLDISGDKYDTVLTMLINQATGFIEGYINRSLLSQSYVEVRDGSGAQEMVLWQTPVTTLAKLEVNSNTIGDPSWQTIDSSRYGWYSDGRIKFSTAFSAFLASESAYFLEGPQRYRITYTAGYLIDFDNENNAALHTLPQDIEYACLKLVSAIFNTRKAEGLVSATVDRLNMRYRGTVMSDPELKDILSGYQESYF